MKRCSPSFIIQFSSVQSLSRVRLFATPWITACQTSLSITNSQSSLKLTSIESVMPSSHLILCRPLFLLPLIPPSIRVFSNESTLCMRWPKYWSSALASFLPKKSQGWSPLGWTGWISLQSKGLSRVFSNTTVQKHQFFGTQLSSWPLEKPYANENYNKESPHTSQNDHHQRVHKQQVLERGCTAGGNVNWYHHYGRQHKDSFKN